MISPEVLGKRIATLRKRKGYSQSDLSRYLKISRSSVTQIERGSRNISILEFKKISETLVISMDELLSENFELKSQEIMANEPEPKYETRDSAPVLHPEKFKNILLYILEHCAGKPNVGETLLYKLLYFSDFNYYELYEEHLSGAEYRKLPFGPVPHKIESIINTMMEQQQLQRIKTEYHGYPQTRFIPLVKPNLKELKASEKDIIDKVIEQFSDWSASAISNYSHQDMPWKATSEAEIIDYELAFYREPPFSVRNDEEENYDI
ncbi:MAG: DUF4065 domain-containing protein [Prolixibacteraceae bacterium]|nr:DUF4065 domain-containing protein [Prolixibacteraceae bacterium]